MLAQQHVLPELLCYLQKLDFLLSSLQTVFAFFLGTARARGDDIADFQSASRGVFIGVR